MQEDATTMRSSDSSAIDAAAATSKSRRNGKRPRIKAENDAGQSSTVAVTEADAAPAIADNTTSVSGEMSGRPSPDAFIDERDDVLAVINELEDQLDRYEEIRESLERDLAESNEQRQVAQQRVQELEWQTVTLQTRVEALEQVRQEVSLLEEEITDANTRSQRLTEQLSQTEKETARLKAEMKAANKQLEELWAVRKERDGLRIDMKNAAAKLDQALQTNKDLTEERGALQSTLQENQIALDESRSAKSEFELNLRTAGDRNEEMRKTVEDLQQKIDVIRGDKKNLQAQLTHVERENTRLIEQRQFYECELTSLRSMNRNAESALANVKKAFSEVRVALAETKSRARRRTLESLPRTGGGLRGANQPETRAAEPVEAGVE